MRTAPTNRHTPAAPPPRSAHAKLISAEDANTLCAPSLRACRNRYNPELTAQWTREIADEIKNKLKTELELPRYKFVVQVEFYYFIFSSHLRLSPSQPSYTPVLSFHRWSLASSGVRACAWVTDAFGMRIRTIMQRKPIGMYARGPVSRLVGRAPWPRVA